MVPLCCGISTHRIQAKRVRWKLTGPRERGGSLLWSLGMASWSVPIVEEITLPQNWHKGASKEPLQQRFGPAWKNGLVLTDLPPFIVASSAGRQLAPAPAPRPTGRADEIGKIRIGFEDNTGQIKRDGSGRRVWKTSRRHHQGKQKKSHRRITSNYVFVM